MLAYVRTELFLIAYYLWFWVSPQSILALDSNAIYALIQFPILEFIFGHSSTALLSLILVQRKALIRGGNLLLRVLLPWGLLYGLFLYVLLTHDASHWVTLLFLCGVLQRALNSKDYQRAGRLLMHQIVRFSLFMLTIPVMMLSVIPVLGATSTAVVLPESSGFAGETERLLCWIISFFLCVYLYDVFLAKKLEASGPWRMMDRA